MNSALISLCRRCACVVVAISLFGFGLPNATAQLNQPGNTILEILPVSVNTGAGIITGDTVELTGGGVIVEFEIRVSNWGATGDGSLLTVQAKIDGNSYCSGVGDALNPLGYPHAPVNSCPQGNGCPVDGNTCDQGGFITTKVCAFGTNPGAPCAVNGDCLGGVCAGNPDYIFDGFNPIAAAAFPGLDFEYASVSQNGAKADATCVGGVINGMACGAGNECFAGTCTGPPISAYMGTLLVEVPAGAKGTYTIDLTEDSERTFSADGDAVSFAIIAANSHPAFIVIPCVPGPNCEDCNACTTDIVNADLSCSNLPNFNLSNECCNPSNGAIAIVDDGNDCTRDICDSFTGNVFHNNLNIGTPCGGPPVGVCDAQNTCAFLGICQENAALLGVPCGDSITTACSNPDSCDGFGLCDIRDLANGTSCDDGLFCSVADTCLSGVCIGNARNCSDNIPCTADSCDEGLMSCINDEIDCVCTTIVSGDPPSCTIDARIPHLLTQSASLLGWDSMDIDFNIGCSCDTLSIGDLSVSDAPGSPDSDVVPGQAVITGITGGASNLCTVEFAAPIPSNQWTCVTVRVTGEQQCIGLLPSDIDGDLTVTLSDVSALGTLLNLSTGLPHETDINRDGASSSLDVVESINLLAGAGQFAAWLDANISQVCP